MVSPELLKKLIAAIKEQDGEAALAIAEELLVGSGDEGAPPADPTQSAADPAPAPPVDPEKEEMAALGREVSKLAKAANPGEALTLVKGVYAEHDRADADRVSLEQSERRGLVAELVKLHAETPDTAWTRDESGAIIEGASRAPVKRLAEEPIAELRSRVKALRAASATPITPLVETSAKPISAKLAAELKKRGVSLEEFNEIKNSAVRRIK